MEKLKEILSMRWLLMLAAAMTLSLSLAACGDDDDEEEEVTLDDTTTLKFPNYNNQHKLISSIAFDGKTTEFEYDEKNRLIKVNRPRETDFYYYNDSEVIYRRDSGHESCYKYYLKNGLIIKQEYEKEPQYWSEYIYDNNHRVCRINKSNGESYDITYENEVLSRCNDVVDINYLNQPCLNPMTYYSGGNGFNFLHGAFSGTQFPFDPALMSQGLFGNTTITHLINSYTQSLKTKDYFVTLDYTLNNDGTPLKVYENNRETTLHWE